VGLMSAMMVSWCGGHAHPLSTHQPDEEERSHPLCVLCVVLLCVRSCSASVVLPFSPGTYHDGCSCVLGEARGAEQDLKEAG